MFLKKKSDTVAKPGRIVTPTLLQMEAVECGAAALGIILAHHGRIVPLEELRIRCGVSRDGTKASNMVRAAQGYGLIGKGYKKELEELYSLKPPYIVFWNFNHFLVVEGFGKNKVFLNDPAEGPRVVPEEEFDHAYTGVVLTFEKGDDFVPGGEKPSPFKSFSKRLSGLQHAVLFVILVSFLLIIPGLVVPTFSRIFIDDILVGKKKEWFTLLLIGMGMTALMRAGLTWLQQYFLMRFDMKLAIVDSSRFFWHVLRLPVEFFTQRYGGEIGNRVEINDKVARLLSSDISTTILDLIMAIFFAFLLFQYDVLLTLIGILIASINIVFLKYISRKRVDGNKRLLNERGKLVGTVMSGLQMIESLKASGNESDFFSKWAGYHAKTLDAEQRLGLTSNLLGVVPPFLMTFNTVAILSIGGLRVIDGSLTMGMLIAYQSLMASFMEPVNKLVTIGNTLQETEGDINRLDDVMQYPVDQYIAHDEKRLREEGFADNLYEKDEIPARPLKLSGNIELRDIKFGYSKLSDPLIDHFNLSIKPGGRIAIVGGSGCGKSTMAKLITGLYAPWDGQIYFDGTHYNDIRRSMLTNSIGLVDQEIFLFKGTIRENLTMWDSTVPENVMIEAAKDACIHDDIVSRPGGYDGEVSEMGRNFSGGQRQRLEIARVLCGRPTILVLDEATSALDPATEMVIDGNIRRRGCTCVIIAHRLSTIRDSDEIIVLDRGVISERGTHDELMKCNGIYAGLIRSI